jgi:competence protein ComGC
MVEDNDPWKNFFNDQAYDLIENLIIFLIIIALIYFV